VNHKASSCLFTFNDIHQPVLDLIGLITATYLQNNQKSPCKIDIYVGPPTFSLAPKFPPTFLTLESSLHQWIRRKYCLCVAVRRATMGAFGAFSSPEIFKTLHSNFYICRNVPRIKMKFHILIIFNKSYWNYSLSCSLIIISLQDLSWDRLTDRKFRKWLAFDNKYAGSVKTWEII